MANFLVFSLVLVCICTVQAISNNSFPADFMFGAGSSAYQIEGEWNKDDKSENIWDHDLHNKPDLVDNKENGDIADDSFDYSDFDIKALKSLGVDHYKFSISWSRLLPYINDTESQTGEIYYSLFIENLIKNKITPIVTLYHWDLPEIAQDQGGWLNEDIIDHFVDYARFVFKISRNVPYFITFDDPKQICIHGYGDGTLAPFSTKSGIDDYVCVKNVLKAHAAVYQMFQKEFKEVYPDAQISIVLDTSWSVPASNSKEDVAAAERRNQFEFGLYAHPIIFGDWPTDVRDRIDLRSKGENRSESRLPLLTKDEIQEINGTADFIAIDFFDTRLVANDLEAKYGEPGYEKDLRVKLSTKNEWDIDADDHAIVPGNLRQLLKYIKQTYKDPKILITANGLADDSGTLDDNARINFLSEQLSDVADAIAEDKVRVFGYTYWSLLDSFEWTKGYKPHFGLYAVNLNLYESDSTRLPKTSAHYYALAVKDRKIPDPNTWSSTTLNPSPETTTKITRPTRVTTKSPVTQSSTDSNVTQSSQHSTDSTVTQSSQPSTDSNVTSPKPESTTHGSGYSILHGSHFLYIFVTIVVLISQRFS